ncbi:N-acetylneuraminate synthase family protein [Pelagibacteraceae bacterium]|nr:N-acetylneuraminate synthase family protein [Pelagibacteraceae bacterium]
MKLFNINLNKKVFIIAEIGVNHEGDYLRAKKLIILAARNGADAVKFQFYTPEKFIAKDYEERFNRVKSFCLKKDTIQKLILIAKKNKIPIFATPVSHDYVDFIDKNFGVIKIASGDCTFEKLLHACAKTKSKILLSTGNTDINEVKKSISYLKKHSKINLHNRLILMHCVSSYPASLKDLNLKVLNLYKKKFNFVLGYSNHAINYEIACLSAVSLGARVIEVHFTDSKKNRKFRDHHLSLLPSDLKRLRYKIDETYLALGSEKKNIQKSEFLQNKMLKKGIVAKMDLSKGHQLKLEDLDFARPALFYNANAASKLIGKKIKKGVKSSFLITRKNIL